MMDTTRYMGRGAEILVGLVYLVAAFLKAQDINLFIGQILAYQIFVTPDALTLVAFSTVALEAFVGLSLVLGSPWRRTVLALSAAMLIFFSAIIAYAWQVHGLKDCGCFGSVSFTPLQAIGKNVVLLFLNGVAWYALVHRDVSPALGRRGIRTALPAALALVLCGMAAPQLGSPGAPQAPVPPTDAAAPAAAAQPVGGAVFSGYEFTTEYGESFNLGEGEFLVALLSMTCDHCMASVPQINAYMAESALPPVVALCLEPVEGSMEEFQALSAPMFPMYSIGNNMLEWARICPGTPPRLSFVRSGAVLATWNEEMPDYQTLVGALSEREPVQSE